eukprot:PLAT2965.1.p2 GENE.PLAT2965.1~~PLAT2965.1.p2  ORF type:complete len:181 (+),score=75.82 PLAT2965.1:47-544(+)
MPAKRAIPIPDRDEADAPQKHVAYFQMRGSWMFYWFGILAARAALGIFTHRFLSNAEIWTLTNVIHFAIAFHAIHWTKGSPHELQGEMDDWTFWEQLDDGVPWTASKKFLFITPLLLYGICCHVTNYAVEHLIVNTFVVGVQCVAKLPDMHGVRLFGVNRSLKEE